MKTVILGITGGIAAVKIPELITKLASRDISIQTIMTPAAERILSPKKVEQMTGNPVFRELFPQTFTPGEILKKRNVEHIRLADSADLFVIVPATANVIARLASGIADDYLTTTALAATCPIVVCPSMNVHMWNHAATQRNIETVRHLGYHILGPDSGMLACGYSGTGRLVDTGALSETISSFTSLAKPLSGKRVLVTAGATIEPIDDVRYITNKSSGKMGIALAEAAYLAGAEVLLLRSHTSVRPRIGLREEVFDTADSLHSLIKRHSKNFDICIHTAAVSDFEVKNRSKGKTSSTKPLALELEPRKKILETIKTYNPRIFLVAFKAEYNVTGDTLIQIARKRLLKAHADLIVANDVGKEDGGFGSDINDVYIIPARGKPVHIPMTSKTEIAERIITFL